jgi:hypothetical protein
MITSIGDMEISNNKATRKSKTRLLACSAGVRGRANRTRPMWLRSIAAP